MAHKVHEQVHRFNDGVLPSKVCFDKNILYTSIDFLRKWWTATNEGKVIYESAKYIIALSWREREKRRRKKKEIRKLKIELRNENRTESRIIAADTHIYPTRLFIHIYICIRNTLPLGSFDTVSILSLSLSSVKRERDRKTKEGKKPINQPFALRDRNPKLAYFI